MVYFKINSVIIELIRLSEMNLSKIACSRYCSRQVISYDSLNMMLKQLAYLRDQNKKQLEAAEEAQNN